MQQNESWLTSAAASRLGEINIVFQPVSNEALLLERGAFSTASPGQRESHTQSHPHPGTPPQPSQAPLPLQRGAELGFLKAQL